MLCDGWLNNFVLLKTSSMGNTLVFFFHFFVCGGLSGEMEVEGGSVSCRCVCVHFSTTRAFDECDEIV